MSGIQNNPLAGIPTYNNLGTTPIAPIALPGAGPTVAADRNAAGLQALVGQLSDGYKQLEALMNAGNAPAAHQQLLRLQPLADAGTAMAANSTYAPTFARIQSALNVASIQMQLLQMRQTAPATPLPRQTASGGAAAPAAPAAPGPALTYDEALAQIEGTGGSLVAPNPAAVPPTAPAAAADPAPDAPSGPTPAKQLMLVGVPGRGGRVVEVEAAPPAEHKGPLGFLGKLADKAGGLLETVGHVVFSPLELLGKVTDPVSRWIGGGLSWLRHGVDNTLGKIPVLGMAVRFTTGLLNSAVSLVGGAVQGVTHPVELIKGLGSMAWTAVGMVGLRAPWDAIVNGKNPIESLKDSWGEAGALGKGLVGAAWEDVKQGNYAGAVGQLTGDIGSFFVGAGEVGAAGKLAELSGAAGKVSRLSKVAKMAEAGELGGRVGKLANGANLSAKVARASELAKVAKLDKAVALGQKVIQTSVNASGAIFKYGLTKNFEVLNGAGKLVRRGVTGAVNRFPKMQKVMTIGQEKAAALRARVATHLPKTAAEGGKLVASGVDASRQALRDGVQAGKKLAGDGLVAGKKLASEGFQKVTKLSADAADALGRESATLLTKFPMFDLDMAIMREDFADFMQSFRDNMAERRDARKAAIQADARADALGEARSTSQHTEAAGSARVQAAGAGAVHTEAHVASAARGAKAAESFNPQLFEKPIGIASKDPAAQLAEQQAFLGKFKTAGYDYSEKVGGAINDAFGEMEGKLKSVFAGKRTPSGEMIYNEKTAAQYFNALPANSPERVRVATELTQMVQQAASDGLHFPPAEVRFGKLDANLAGVSRDGHVVIDPALLNEPLEYFMNVLTEEQVHAYQKYMVNNADALKPTGGAAAALEKYQKEIKGGTYIEPPTSVAVDASNRVAALAQQTTDLLKAANAAERMPLAEVQANVLKLLPPGSPAAKVAQDWFKAEGANINFASRGDLEKLEAALKKHGELPYNSDVLQKVSDWKNDHFYAMQPDFGRIYGPERNKLLATTAPGSPERALLERWSAATDGPSNELGLLEMYRHDLLQNGHPTWTASQGPQTLQALDARMKVLTETLQEANSDLVQEVQSQQKLYAEQTVETDAKSAASEFSRMFNPNH